MSTVKTILIIISVLVVLYLILNVFFKESNTLTSMQNGDEAQIIVANTLPRNNNSSNYTYSTWFYVNDWNYRFGEEKTVLQRTDTDGNPSPSIVFGAVENNIIVSVSCYPTNQTDGTITNTSITHKCSIPNFPLQTWVNLIISLYGRTLDMYIDGKLVRTCVLPGVAKVNPDANISITPGGGFSGWTSNFEYWDTATNPQQAYNIYKTGYGGSSSIFNKYKIKISFLEDNQEQASFKI